MKNFNRYSVTAVTMKFYSVFVKIYGRLTRAFSDLLIPDWGKTMVLLCRMFMTT